MKEEYQSTIDSIRKCLPMQNMLIDLENDPLHVEKMPIGSVMFMESQCETRNFVQSFVTRANVSRQSSDCDLMSHCLRTDNEFGKAPK